MQEVTERRRTESIAGLSPELQAACGRELGAGSGLKARRGRDRCRDEPGRAICESWRSGCLLLSRPQVRVKEPSFAFKCRLGIQSAACSSLLKGLSHCMRLTTRANQYAARVTGEKVKGVGNVLVAQAAPPGTGGCAPRPSHQPAVRCRPVRPPPPSVARGASVCCPSQREGQLNGDTQASPLARSECWRQRASLQPWGTRLCSGLFARGGSASARAWPFRQRRPCLHGSGTHAGPLAAAGYQHSRASFWKQGRKRTMGSGPRCEADLSSDSTEPRSPRGATAPSRASQNRRPFTAGGR